MSMISYNRLEKTVKTDPETRLLNYLACLMLTFQGRLILFESNYHCFSYDQNIIMLDITAIILIES